MSALNGFFRGPLGGIFNNTAGNSWVATPLVFTINLRNLACKIHQKPKWSSRPPSNIWPPNTWTSCGYLTRFRTVILPPNAWTSYCYFTTQHMDFVRLSDGPTHGSQDFWWPKNMNFPLPVPFSQPMNFPTPVPFSQHMNFPAPVPFCNTWTPNPCGTQHMCN